MEYDFYKARVQKILRREKHSDKMTGQEICLVAYGFESETGPCDTAYQIIDNRMHPEQEEA